MPGGRLPGSRYATCAISATVRDLVGVPRTLATPSMIVDVVGGGFQQVGRDRRHLSSQVLRRDLDRGTEDRATSTPAGAERVRRLARVALMHRRCRRTRHRGTRSRTARSSSRDLGHAIPSRGRRRPSRRAGRGCAQVRCCTARSCSAARCTARCRLPRGDRPQLLPLPDAELVVVDHRRRLLECLGRRHVEHRDAERQRVREARRAASTLRRRSSSGSMPICRARTVDRLLAEVGLELPGSPIRRS